MLINQLFEPFALSPFAFFPLLCTIDSERSEINISRPMREANEIIVVPEQPSGLVFIRSKLGDIE